MFKKIKSAFGGKKLSRTEQAKSYDLSDKPFAQALLLRASQHQDEAIHDLKETVGHTRPIAEDKTLDEFAASCAATIAHHITTKAMKNIGRNAAFLPYDPIPKYASMVVAFSLYVLLGIQGQLKAEGIELDFQELAADTANLFFMCHPDEERVKNVTDGIKAFQTVTQAEAANVKEWHDNLMQLIPIYVLQWTAEKQALREVDCVPLFGGMLSSLLKAVE